MCTNRVNCLNVQTTHAWHEWRHSSRDRTRQKCPLERSIRLSARRKNLPWNLQIAVNHSETELRDRTESRFYYLSAAMHA